MLIAYSRSYADNYSYNKFPVHGSRKATGWRGRNFSTANVIHGQRAQGFLSLRGEVRGRQRAHTSMDAIDPNMNAIHLLRGIVMNCDAAYTDRNGEHSS